MGQSYLKNAALLTGADVLLRLAGMGLRIYLANALGGEGWGCTSWCWQSTHSLSRWQRRGSRWRPPG